MAEIDNSRHFSNKYPDYNPVNPDQEVLTQSGLSDAFLKRLRRNRNRLLLRHYQDYAKIKDDDYSVYTGELRWHHDVAVFCCPKLFAGVGS